MIAAINGPAAGGGLAFALASDIRIAAADAIFAVSFIRAGYSACDIGTSWLLPRIVGTGRAHELMLTGRRCSADEALQMGLVASVVPPSDLTNAAQAKAEEIMQNPPLSVELTKQACGGERKYHRSSVIALRIAGQFVTGSTKIRPRRNRVLQKHASPGTATGEPGRRFLLAQQVDDCGTSSDRMCSNVHVAACHRVN